jgi:hypothetical protein
LKREREIERERESVCVCVCFKEEERPLNKKGIYGNEKMNKNGKD